jgi:hypothetical protein
MERLLELEQSLAELSKYKIANTVPCLPIQVLNNLTGRQKEEFQYLLDQVACEYIEKNKLKPQFVSKEECLDEFINGEK